jgi:hypothetical protein
LSPFCVNFRELGIGIVAYSPLGRGFLSGGAKLVESLSEQDFRKVNSLRYLWNINYAMLFLFIGLGGISYIFGKKYFFIVNMFEYYLLDLRYICGFCSSH